MKPTRTYRKWSSMKARCYRPSHPAFEYYGGRGITVCDRWRDDYQAFLADMGEAPPGYWIDRIDIHRGYELGNCRWVTPAESAKNRRPRQQIPGSLRQLARAAGLPYMLVYLRIQRGWTRDQALSIPKQSKGGMKRSDKVRLGLSSPV